MRLTRGWRIETEEHAGHRGVEEGGEAGRRTADEVDALVMEREGAMAQAALRLPDVGGQRAPTWTPTPSFAAGGPDQVGDEGGDQQQRGEAVEMGRSWLATSVVKETAPDPSHLRLPL